MFLGKTIFNNLLKVTTYKMKYFVLDEADRFLSKQCALDDLRRLNDFGYLVFF